MENIQYAAELTTDESTVKELNLFVNKEEFKVVDPETGGEEIKFAYTMDTFKKEPSTEMRTISKATAEEIMRTTCARSEDVERIISKHNNNIL